MAAWCALVAMGRYRGCDTFCSTIYVAAGSVVRNRIVLWISPKKFSRCVVVPSSLSRGSRLSNFCIFFLFQETDESFYFNCQCSLQRRLCTCLYVCVGIRVARPSEGGMTLCGRALMAWPLESRITFCSLLLRD